MTGMEKYRMKVSFSSGFFIFNPRYRNFPAFGQQAMENCLIQEVSYRTSRSGGPGGQHVNKTETRVELLWDPLRSACLTEVQKIRVIKELASRITAQGLLVLACEDHRSQLRNREEVNERFLYLIRSALVEKKKRVRTRPTSSSREKRIRTKKIRGEIKRLRKGPSAE
jgi:ribosome-associated protein